MKYLVILVGLFMGFVSGADQTFKPVIAITTDLSVTTITSAAYVQLSASLGTVCTGFYVWNTAAKPIYLAIGPAGAETKIQYDIGPGGGDVHWINQPTPNGTRLSARAIGADATSGYLIVNCVH